MLIDGLRIHCMRTEVFMNNGMNNNSYSLLATETFKNETVYGELNNFI